MSEITDIVTGAFGFIGRYITAQLINSGRSVKTITTHVAKQSLQKSQAIHLLNDTFRLQYTENPGAFLSLGANIPEIIRYWIFTLLGFVFLSGLLIYLLMAKHLTKHQTMAMCLVLGGGFGNLIDRICNQGRVVDFMNLGIGYLRTGVFNVADIAITFGIILFLIISVKSRSKGPIRL